MLSSLANSVGLGDQKAHDRYTLVIGNGINLEVVNHFYDLFYEIKDLLCLLMYLCITLSFRTHIFMDFNISDFK